MWSQAPWIFVWYGLIPSVNMADLSFLDNISVFFSTIKEKYLQFAGPKTSDGRIISTEWWSRVAKLW